MIQIVNNITILAIVLTGTALLREREHGTLNYLKQLAQAADDLGYYGVSIPTGRSCEDSWLPSARCSPGPAAGSATAA